MTVRKKTYKRKPSPTLQTAQLKDQSQVITNYLANELQELENVLIIQEQAGDENNQSLAVLTSAVNGNTASITNEAAARTSADSALADLLTNLTATVTSGDSTNASAITAEQTARADADSALASDITSLTSTVTNNNNTLAAAVANEATARANADTANASSINTVSASVTTEANARAAADTAEANARIAADNAITASVTTEASVRAAADNTLLAKYGVTLNSNGYVTGFSQNNDGTTGTFKILADKFTIVDPSDNAGEAGTEVFGISNGLVSMQNVKIGTAIIDDNAVTIPSGAYSTGLEWGTAAYNSTAISSWETAQQVTFTGTGAPVALFWSFVAYVRAGIGSSPHYAKLFVRITRNGSEIQHLGQVITEESTSLNKNVVSGSFIDTTGYNGSVNYKLEVRRQGYYVDVAHKSLTTLELKK